MQRREYILQESVVALKGATCASVAVSTTSAQSAAVLVKRVVLYSTVDVFFRQGSNPTALADGTDQILPALTMLRVVDIEDGNKLAFKTASGTGTVYIAPAA